MIIIPMTNLTMKVRLFDTEFLGCFFLALRPEVMEYSSSLSMVFATRAMSSSSSSFELRSSFASSYTVLMYFSHLDESFRRLLLSSSRKVSRKLSLVFPTWFTTGMSKITLTRRQPILR